MADKLGVLFLNAAMGPLNYAGQCIMQRRVKQGINELAIESLMGAVERGIGAVAKAAGLPPGYVHNLLPMNEIALVAARIAENQRVAMEQWEVHTGHIGGLLDGVADLTIDNRPPDASLCLLRVSKKMQLDKQLAVPLRQLSDDLVTWQELIASCRTFIDDGRSLETAYRQRRLVRLGALVAGALAVAVVVVWVVRVRLARGRVEASLALDDPCSADAITSSDLGKASDEQKTRVEERRSQCALAAEEARLAEEAKQRELARVAAEKEQAALRVAACGRLGASLASKQPDISGLAEATPHAALLERIAKATLEPDDVGKLSALPCMDTDAATPLAEHYLRGVLATAALWMVNTTPSKAARELMVKGKNGVTPRQLTIFGRHVEEMAKRAVRKGDDAALKRVEVLCGLEKSLGIRIGQHCEAAATILAPD